MTAPQRDPQGPAAAASAYPLQLPFEVGGRDHVVQFYESDEYLADLVARFLGLGLAAGEPAVAFATPERRDAILERLRASGADVDTLRARGLLQFRDARETLGRCMAGGLPDSERLALAVGAVLDEATDRGRRGRARVFGEMVDLLSKDGDQEGASRLEELWNDLAAIRPVAILCAYSLGNFYRERHAPAVRDVCLSHAKVLPTERFLRISDDEAARREIAQLQQRSAALEFEVERCHALEASLREAAASARAAESERAALLERERALRTEAEAASRAKDEFLALLGHELRNPLAPIVTALEIRRLRGEDTNAPEWRIIDRQVRRIVRMVDDLMDVQRLTRGRVVLQKERVDVASTVADALGAARPLLEERRHEVRIDLPAAALFVEGDATRLAQVVTHLLTNAAKYTEPGGRVSLTAVRDNGHVVVAVRDTGIGIEKELLDRVFDAFVQEPRGAERAAGGLGLGLAIVRNLVRLHGGTVEARSAGRGCGSEFVVRLPAAPERTRATASRPDENGRGGARPVRARRILIVDDNADTAETFAQLLAVLGHRTVIAHDGPSALRIAREFAPEVVFLDIGLPGMDGYELAAALRRLPALAASRLVAVTGYGQPSDRVRSARAGFDLHLVKPVEPETVGAIVE